MSGSTVARTPHFALHRVPLTAAPGADSLFPLAEPCVGVIIPKRWARRAVTRNTIRRQIYELARTMGDALPRAAMVVRLRSEFSRKVFISATSDVLKAAVRAELQVLLGAVKLRAPVAGAHHAG